MDEKKVKNKIKKKIIFGCLVKKKKGMNFGRFWMFAPQFTKNQSS